MKLSRQEKMEIILQLHTNCKAGIALPDEYTIGKYDFLLSEGFVVCPNAKRNEYYNKAKSEYQYELQNIVHTGSIVESKTATQLLINMQEGKFTFDQSKYLAGKVKIIALKEFMQNEEKIIFT